MRTNSTRPVAPDGAVPTGTSEAATVEAILTEVSAWVGELRCASMSRLVQSQVSMSQMHVLWMLQHHGAMTMSRIAELIGVSMSNATGIIDRMEEHGLVERERTPDDRRVVIVRPAAGGLRALSETESSKRERMHAVLGRLPRAERPIVLAALKSLRRALSAEVESAPIHEHHFTEAAH